MTTEGAPPARLVVRAGGRDVPAVLWRPAGGPAPLVLLGHGGSGHKTSPRQVALAERLVHSGCAVVAIDGPIHGERAGRQLTPREYQEELVDRGVDQVVAQMTEDWLAAAEAAGRIGGVDADRVGYLGLSMGTRFGLSTAATLGDRLRCAVLGKFGLTQGGALHPGIHVPGALRRYARAVKASTLWHVQWDDELFPRAGSFELFDELGPDAKQLVAFPGGHAETTRAAFDLWVDFLARHLLAATGAT